VRVFVALDIPEEVRVAIGALIEKLRPTSDNILADSKRSPNPARWVRIEGIHVTLKFIGEIPPETIEPIKASLSQIHFPNFPPKTIDLKFRGVGFFPNERRPRVLWAGIEAGAELGALAAAIETSLEPLGIAKEQRNFSPHLTLARFDTARQKPAASAFDRLHEAISKAGPLEFGSSTASEFHLYQSILKRGGAEYTRLATFRFVGGESQ
jgi:RNA 2',3'-cyclic 3'-phosphodiesterase